MPIQERVTGYTVTQLKNDVVPYQQVVNLMTESGHRSFIAFQDPPPASWLTFTGNSSTIYLDAGQFDRVFHLLQTVSPLYFTALNLFGLRAFDLGTGSAMPGTEPGDDPQLAQLATQVLQLGNAPPTGSG